VEDLDVKEGYAYCYWESPIGSIRLATKDDRIVELYFRDRDPALKSTVTPLLKEAQMQLAAYFSGKLRYFDLPLSPEGTVFQQKVWDELWKIPYGTLYSYLDIALHLGDRNKVRAVGRANGQNPVSIIIPCHRVIGSNGKLVGYGGGLWRKEWLLHHEGVLLV
jgi:O-6-methylguanine DNA methyltransferase